MPGRKKRKKVKENVESLNEQIKETSTELYYISETDAEIIPFEGQKADSVTAENLLSQLGRAKDIKIEEKGFNEFFEPLIKTEDWFGEEERKMTEKFIRLKELLQTNLTQLKFFRFGKKEIDIFVVGLDKDSILRGIQTEAVET